MELAAVKKTSEDIRHLRLNNTGPVIGHVQNETIIRILDRHDRHGYIRQDMRIFTRIQRIVDRFLHCCKKCLTRIIKTKQVTVLRKKLTDTNIALLGRHRLSSRSYRFSLPTPLNRHNFCRLIFKHRLILTRNSRIRIRIHVVKIKTHLLLRNFLLLSRHLNSLYSWP